MSEVYTVAVDQLVPYPGNARRGDVPAIMRSLERFGQVKPIIVQRSTRYVVAGNHVLEAAKRLGWTTVKVIVEDLDDDAARAYLIADNRTSDRGSYSRSAMFDLLGQVLDLGGTGYSDDDVQELAGEAGGGAEGEEKEDEVVRRSRERYEPMREILIMVPVSEMPAFSRKVGDLQAHWGFKTTVETIRQLVEMAHAALPEPEAAFVVPKLSAEA